MSPPAMCARRSVATFSCAEADRRRRRRALLRTTLDFEHHRPLKRAETVVNQKKRHKDGGDAHRHEPFIANVNRWMKSEPVCRKLVVELPDKRFECGPLKPQAKLGNPPLEQFLVAE